MGVLYATGTLALNNGVGKTPALGWSSAMDPFGCKITEATYKQQADLLVSLGLSSLGYNFVNLDDCWNSNNRDANFHIIQDTTAFPSPMKDTFDYVHSKGLKAGIHASAGKTTCNGRMGSLTYEQIDAGDFAAWGVDFLRYDNCNGLNIPGKDRFSAMRDAIAKTGSKIYYSMSTSGEEDVLSWGPAVANSWTTYAPMNQDKAWESVKNNFYYND